MKQTDCYKVLKHRAVISQQGPQPVLASLAGHSLAHRSFGLPASLGECEAAGGEAMKTQSWRHAAGNPPLQPRGHVNLELAHVSCM